MPRIDEIAEDLYRISVFVPEINLQFNHFLVKDDEPLLYHTGYRRMFDPIREAVAQIIDPQKIRWIGFSHFESDECGSLNQWLETAPAAQPVCSVVGALVSVNDFANRPPKGMTQDEVLETGKYRFRFCSTAHLPHGWDAGVLFEETQRTLLCSDLCHHDGDPEPLTSSDIVARSRDAMTRLQCSPLANYVPYTPLTGRIQRVAVEVVILETEGREFGETPAIDVQHGDGIILLQCHVTGAAVVRDGDVFRLEVHAERDQRGGTDDVDARIDDGLIENIEGGGSDGALSDGAARHIDDAA